jgi:hypothetical protein
MEQGKWDDLKSKSSGILKFLNSDESVKPLNVHIEVDIPKGDSQRLVSAATTNDLNRRTADTRIYCEYSRHDPAFCF